LRRAGTVTLCCFVRKKILMNPQATSAEPRWPKLLEDDLAGLLEYLKIKKAHIVGLSLGRRVAVDIAMAYPKRVNSLALAGPNALVKMDPLPVLGE
jgi:pimeloyl-ACP methyl ester carboxylesterase